MEERDSQDWPASRKRHPMKRWALVVVALYSLILVVLTLPFGVIVFVPQAAIGDVMQAYGAGAYWLWLGVMAVSQAALLVVPVQVASRRPVTRRSLLWPVGVAGLMMGGLAVGVMYSLYEFAMRDKSLEGWFWWAGIGGGMSIWAAWAVMFYRSSRTAAPPDVVSRQCRLLLRGSILELLIAVPTHIVARSRDYCCAGVMTFIGLTLGLSVMLFSFGPAVFFLYADRWRRLHPQAVSEAEPAV
jgi:hypothetical protein